MAHVAVSAVARRGPPVDISRLQFPTEIATAIGTDIQDRFGTDSAVEELLRAVAWAEGDGFPERIWLAVARALPSVRTHVDGDVERAISEADDYLVGTTPAAGEGRWWRLFHPTYVEYFQRMTLEDMQAERRAVQAAIVAAITPPSWEEADCYVVTNLATHAEQAGTLGTLVQDAEYLVHAEPSVLLVALSYLPAEDEGQPAARRYRRVAHRLAGAVLGERAAYLQLAAAEVDDPGGGPSRRPDQPWSLRWRLVTSFESRPHRVLPVPGSGQTVSLHHLDGRTVAVTGGERVHVVDLATGRSLFSADRGGNPYARGFAALVEWPGDPSVLTYVELPQNPRDESGRLDTTSIEVRRWLRTWSLATGQEAAVLTGAAGELVRGCARPFAVGRNRRLAAALGEGGLLEQDCLVGRAWIPASLSDLVVSCLFVLPAGEDDIVLVGSDRGEVTAYSVNSGELGRARGHDTAVTAVAGAATSLGDVVVSGDRQQLHLWRLTEDRALDGPVCSQETQVEGLACAELDGLLYVATVAEGRGRLWRADLQQRSIEPVGLLDAGADNLTDIAFVTPERGGPFLVASGGATERPNALNVSGWGAIRPSSGAIYVWEGLELVRTLPTRPVRQRSLCLAAPVRMRSRNGLEPVVTLLEGNWLTVVDCSNGEMWPGFPADVDVDGTPARALDAVELGTGELALALGYASGAVLASTSTGRQWMGARFGGRPIRSVALAVASKGTKQMLVLDEASDLRYLTWEERLDDGVMVPPQQANSLYSSTRGFVHARPLADGELSVQEVLPLARVVHGVSASALRDEPTFVISGGAGCVMAVDPLRPQDSVDIGFDFPTTDARLAEGYLAVQGEWEILLFRVGDDPSRAAAPGLELGPADQPLARVDRGPGPVWRGSWAARVSAMSLRQGPSGARLAVGCMDGAVHRYDVGSDGVTHAFSLDCGSPVTGIMSSWDGGTVVATWNELLCVE